MDRIHGANKPPMESTWIADFAPGGIKRCPYSFHLVLKSSVRSFVFLFGKERKRKKKERNEESSSAAGLVKQDFFWIWISLEADDLWEKLDRFSIRWEWKSIFFFFFLKKEFFSKVFVFVSLRIFSNGNSASWFTPMTISWPTIRLYDGRHPDCGQPVVANAHFL